MNIEEYKKTKQILIDKLLANLRKLDIEYLQANDSVKAGDVIEDHIGKVKVIRVVFNSPSYKYLSPKEMEINNPYTTCIGEELKKNGEPKKIPTQRTVYKLNLK
jgi:hypothetical protein